METPVSTSILSEDSERVLLRWSEAPNAPSSEEFVHLIEARPSEAVIRSARKVLEKVRVYLVGRQYRGAGVVHSCRREGNSFILTIVITDNSSTEHRSDLDPGIFSVDDFLTEEQEALILKDLESGPSNTIFDRRNS